MGVISRDTPAEALDRCHAGPTDLIAGCWYCPACGASELDPECAWQAALPCDRKHVIPDGQKCAECEGGLT